MLKNPSIQDLKMNCKIILKHFALALILLNFITVVAQNTNIKSPALETLIQQIDENYIPSGWNDGMNSMDKLAKSIPQIYFTFLGTAMKKQEFYTKKNPVASKNYKNLNQEILLLIPDLVDLKNSEISNNDQPINAIALEDIYYGALMGNINENFNQNYKKNMGKYLSQISIPSVLDKQTAGGISYRKVAKKEKDEIVLLGRKVVTGSSNSELTGPFITGLKCPIKKEKAYIFIDTNNNPNDRTYITCDYSNGILYKQTPYVDGYEHGEYRCYSTREDYPFFLQEHGNYKDGKKDGIWNKYSYWNNLRKILLEKQLKFDNGIRVFEERYMPTKSGQSIYLEYRSSHVKGKQSESTYFYKNGKKRMHSILNASTSTWTKVGCWDKNGTKIPCPSYW